MKDCVGEKVTENSVDERSLLNIIAYTYRGKKWHSKV